MHVLKVCKCSLRFPGMEGVKSVRASFILHLVFVGGFTLVHSVPVGLEPVAVALRDNTLAAVVNHLSDSVSFVDISGSVPRVCTVPVGDEPRDVVFAGEGGKLTFITTAHRGQNSPCPRGEYDVPGIGGGRRVGVR
jgi:hypothetical protein